MTASPSNFLQESNGYPCQLTSLTDKNHIFGGITGSDLCTYVSM